MSDQALSSPHDSTPAARSLRAAGEFLLLLLVCLSPWAFGCTESFYTFLLFTGLSLLALVFSAHVVVSGRLVYQSDFVSVCLLGLVLVNVAQLVPLPEGVVRVLSPTAVEWHRTLRPELSEALPGEVQVPRSGWVKLSVDPAATQFFLVHFLALFLAYLIARNLIASKRSFRRLAWVAFVNGVLLAVLAVGQATSGSRSVLYWRFDAPNQVFGPFVNKNHYPFYIHLCVGLGLGLLLAGAKKLRDTSYRDELGGGGWFRLDWLRSPRLIGLLAGVALMLATVPFSLSRGGVLAALVAGGVVVIAGRRSGLGLGKVFAGLLVVGVGLAAWFGLEPVEKRLTAVSTQNREVRWKMFYPAAGHFPLTGTGGGTLARAEQAFRTDPALGALVVNAANNELLEALVEGGAVRLLLTLGLAAAVLWAVLRGARRLRRRSAGPMLLGTAFGLVAVAAQSMVDFGLHIPAVALLAVVVAAQVMATASEPRGVVLTGGAAVAVAALVAVVGGLLAMTSWRADRVERLKTAASNVARADAADRWDRAATYLEAATRLWPDDAEAWSQLATVYFAAGREADGLRAARAARDRCPLIPAAHVRLGAFSPGFAKSEPPSAHFDRAKKLAGFDADVWYLSGAAALARNDRDAAWADWREALRRSRARLEPVVKQAAAHLDADALRTRVLPDDPEVWVAAGAVLPEAGEAWRRAAAARWAASPPDRESGWVAWTAAREGLGEDAAEVLRRGAERFPESVPLRDRLAAKWEADERYDEALPHLEFLADREPGTAAFRDRLDAARHASRLRREIEGK